jgi:hypothetical protein
VSEVRHARRAILAIVAVVMVLGQTACSSTPQAGEVGVVRNGSSPLWPFDWFDNHNIRGHVLNGSGTSFVGLLRPQGLRRGLAGRYGPHV